MLSLQEQVSQLKSALQEQKKQLNASGAVSSKLEKEVRRYKGIIVEHENQILSLKQSEKDGKELIKQQSAELEIVQSEREHFKLQCSELKTRGESICAKNVQKADISWTI